MITKVLGIVDIIAAGLIFTINFGSFDLIKYFLIAILVIKGIPSLLG